MDLRVEVCRYIGRSLVSDEDLMRAQDAGLPGMVSSAVRGLGAASSGRSVMEWSGTYFHWVYDPKASEERVWVSGEDGRLVLTAVRRFGRLEWEICWYQPGEWEESLVSVHGCLRGLAAVG